jgi:hypothetical protein
VFAAFFQIGPAEAMFLLFIAGMLAVPVAILLAILIVLLTWRKHETRRRDQDGTHD